MTIRLSKPCQHVYPFTVVMGQAVLKPCRNCEHVKDAVTFARVSEAYDRLFRSLEDPFLPAPSHLRAVR